MLSTSNNSFCYISASVIMVVILGCLSGCSNDSKHNDSYASDAVFMPEEYKSGLQKAKVSAKLFFDNLAKGEQFAQQARYDDAIGAYKKSLDYVSPYNPTAGAEKSMAYSRIADVYLALNDLESAIVYLEKARKDVINPAKKVEFQSKIDDLRQKASLNTTENILTE